VTAEGREGSDSDGPDVSGAVSHVSVYYPCILVDILRSGAKGGRGSGGGMGAVSEMLVARPGTAVEVEVEVDDA